MSRTPFSEGINPLDRRVMTYVSNSISTIDIDPYRQGVELTLSKYFQQGIAKIWSGNDGHQINVIDIGQRDDDIFADQDFYLEVAPFNPVLYLTDYFMEQVIVIDSPVNTNENGFDGIIEPLSIRRVISFSSIDAPFEAHSVKGSVETGNHDSFRNSDAVVSKQRHSELSLGSQPYEDNIDMTGQMPTNLGFWPTISTRVNGFDDSQLKDGVIIPGIIDQQMQETLKAMSPATENYLPQDYLSTAASMYNYTDLYIPRSTSLYDPGALPLSGWFKGYTAAPWPGSSSSSNSNVHALSTSGADPTSVSLNSRTVANFVASSTQSLVDSTNAFTTAYVSRTSYSFVLLANPTNPQSPQAFIYNNPALLGDSSSNFAIVWSTSGIAVHHYSSPDYYQTAWLPTSPGWHFIAVTYDGSTLTLYVDGMTTQVQSVPSLAVATTWRVGRSWTSNWIDGQIAEIMISKTVFSPEILNTIRRRYFNPIYNLSV